MTGDPRANLIVAGRGWKITAAYHDNCPHVGARHDLDEPCPLTRTEWSEDGEETR